jgi:hypothetical protein
MNSVCRHHIVKPFTGRDGMQQGSHEEHRCSKDTKEHCTHPYSLHLPGTPGDVICSGDVTKCEIPKAKR